MEKIIVLTEQLMNYLQELKENYEISNKPENNAEFFQRVKKETDPIFDLLDKWEKVALEDIKERKLSIHPKQIDATNDNIRALILHSYYIDVRKRRYMEIYKSCDYILSILLKEANTWNKH